MVDPTTPLGCPCSSGSVNTGCRGERCRGQWNSNNIWNQFDITSVLSLEIHYQKQILSNKSWAASGSAQEAILLRKNSLDVIPAEIYRELAHFSDFLKFTWIFFPCPWVSESISLLLPWVIHEYIAASSLLLISHKLLCCPSKARGFICLFEVGTCYKAQSCLERPSFLSLLGIVIASLHYHAQQEIIVYLLTNTPPQDFQE